MLEGIHGQRRIPVTFIYESVMPPRFTPRELTNSTNIPCKRLSPGQKDENKDHEAQEIPNLEADSQEAS
jgi:hypothetical protein